MVGLLALGSTVALLVTSAAATLSVSIPSIVCQGEPVLITWAGESGGDVYIKTNDNGGTITPGYVSDTSFVWTVNHPLGTTSLQITDYDYYQANSLPFTVQAAGTCNVPTTVATVTVASTSTLATTATSSSVAPTATEDAPPPSCAVDD